MLTRVCEQGSKNKVKKGTGTYLVILFDQLILNGQTFLILQDHRWDRLRICVLLIIHFRTRDDPSSLTESLDDLFSEQSTHVLLLVVQRNDRYTSCVRLTSRSIQVLVGVNGCTDEPIGRR